MCVLAGPKKLPEGVSPEESSNLFSSLFFVYLGPLLSLAQKRTLTTADLWPLHSSDNPGRLKKVFVEAWAHQKTLPKCVSFHACRALGCELVA